MGASNQGGIDQIRVVSQTLLFDQAHTRSRVLVPNADGGALEELTLSLHGSLNPYFSLSGEIFRWPANVQIAIIGQRGSEPYFEDITALLIKELQRLLDMQDRDVTMKAYATGMKRWMDYAGTYFTDRYTPAILERDRKLAAKMVETKLPSDLITQLGDRSFGLEGSLHIFNYLYEYIPLPGVSLKKLLETQKFSFATFSELGIECEEPIPAGGIRQISGGVAITLEAAVHNPLRDQLADLQETITTSLTDIDHKLQVGGDIMQALANAHDQLLALRGTIARFEDHLTSSLAELNQVKASIGNLGQKIDDIAVGGPH